MENGSDLWHLAAQDLADQFARGQNVYTKDLTDLRDFSNRSRGRYGWLMDQVAAMYGVEPLDADQESQPQPDQASQTLSQLAITETDL